MQKVWISGVNGQIGNEIKKVIEKQKYEIFDTDIDDIDITNLNEVINFGEINRPDIIINCSAITDVDRCEKDPKIAYMVNALGARNLSIISRKLQAKFVQVSTDDIFDGTSNRPYTEYDSANPVTIYGKSKLAGENYTKEFTEKHFIVRSSWVYGNGDNFVYDVLEKIDKNKEIVISSNNYGSPTSVRDLAMFILYLIQTSEYGTYHATNKGMCSRLEFAQEILNLTGKTGIIKVVSPNDDNILLNRPQNAVLENFILSIINIYEFVDWKSALKSYLIEEGLYGREY